MTIEQALTNALEFLEALGYESGYQSGDVHDDLKLAIERLKQLVPAQMERKL